MGYIGVILCVLAGSCNTRFERTGAVRLAALPSGAAIRAPNTMQYK